MRAEADMVPLTDLPRARVNGGWMVTWRRLQRASRSPPSAPPHVWHLYTCCPSPQGWLWGVRLVDY